MDSQKFNEGNTNKGRTKEKIYLIIIILLIGIIIGLVIAKRDVLFTKESEKVNENNTQNNSKDVIEEKENGANENNTDNKNSTNKLEEDEIIYNKNVKQIVGIYHNNNWNNHDATLQLNDDMTCNYPSSNSTCKWGISDKSITITLTYFILKFGNVSQTSGGIFPTLDSCNEYIETSDNLINPVCDSKENNHSAILIDSGILLHDHIFEKIN